MTKEEFLEKQPEKWIRDQIDLLRTLGEGEGVTLPMIEGRRLNFNFTIEELQSELVDRGLKRQPIP